MYNKIVKSVTPSITAETAASKLNKSLEKEDFKCNSDDLIYCSWPQVFGNTAGPFGGIGGQAMTTFRMEAWAFENIAVIFCGNKIVRIGEFAIQAKY